jgi:hypothetical protein
MNSEPSAQRGGCRAPLHSSAVQALSPWERGRWSVSAHSSMRSTLEPYNQHFPQDIGAFQGRGKSSRADHPASPVCTLIRTL